MNAARSNEYRLEPALMPDLLEPFAEQKIEGILKKLPAERRLKGLPAEEPIMGLSADELLAALSPETHAALAQRFQGDATRPKPDAGPSEPCGGAS